MAYSDNAIISGIMLSTLLGLLVWLKSKGVSILDRSRVYKWIKSHTKDAPGESHVDIVTISKGIRLPEDLVRRACISCKRIFRYANGKEQWSVWRQIPQSCYEGLSSEEIRKRMLL